MKPIFTTPKTPRTRRGTFFCDIERPLKSRWLSALKRVFSNTVMRAASSQNVAGEPVGAINRFFSRVYGAHLGQADQSAQPLGLL
ncbi:MAG: hypothetical protein RR240_05885, partial [Burkholderiaceae bacterium]